MWTDMTNRNYRDHLWMAQKLFDASVQTLKSDAISGHCLPSIQHCMEYFLRKDGDSFHVYMEDDDLLFFFLQKNPSNERWTILFVRAIGNQARLRELFRLKIEELQAEKKEDFFMIALETDHDRSFEESLNFVDKIKEFGYWVIKYKPQ